MSLTKQIRDKAKEILKERPKGVRFRDLIREVHEAFPEVKLNTLDSALWNLDSTSNGDIVKPERGLFILSKFQLQNEEPISYNKDDTGYTVNAKEQEKREILFYQPFADYLQGELNECNIAKSYGGSKLDRKWMTPDVVGYYKVKTTASFPRAPEIITAEIKITTDYQSAIVGFGQAASYLLYSHKSYLVIPKKLPVEDRRIIESLCTTFGIGLVIFDISSSDNPNFELKNKALRREPDIFYFNKFATKIVDFLEDK